ncbi:MAG: hypothetical protein ACKN89_02105 [Cyanobium sp.]
MTSSGTDSSPSPWEPQLLERLAAESLAFDGSDADPQRNCWLVVHRHVHGVLPSEYDIREIPESLYLAVLDWRMAQQTITAAP